MIISDKYNPYRLLWVSLVSVVFIVYPNIAGLSWELSFLDEAKYAHHVRFFFIRYAFYSLLFWGLLSYNLKKIRDYGFKYRCVRTFLITGGGYGLYVFVMYLWNGKIHGFGSLVLFQFIVIFIVCTFAGHIFTLYNVQRKKEQEIERLKLENLQSRCDALAERINPHFFFNSLNGISALIRKKNEINTLTYVNRLSDVFRYILQSNKKDLVTLGEELAFVQAFRYMMEVRFANKLVFHVEVDEDKMGLKIPALSLLSLIDNIVVHNTIDSAHRMDVGIRLNEKSEMVVSNPVYPKLTPRAAKGNTGMGIRNLENRFALLMNKQIRIEEDAHSFTVYLPLA
jgi:sensor histidine kinase YesM